MTKIAVHNDACGEMLVNGFCHRCNFAPDLQSLAFIDKDAYVPRAALSTPDEVRRAIADATTQLSTRRDELLTLVRKLSAEVPYAEEVGKIGVLLAEVGTLRGEVAELRASISTARDLRAERDAALRALGNFATAVRTGNLDSNVDPDDQAAFHAALAYLRGEPIPPFCVPVPQPKKET